MLKIKKVNLKERKELHLTEKIMVIIEVEEVEIEEIEVEEEDGLIGFVGLVCPHISRLVIGSDNRYLIPASAAFGAALLLFADGIGRWVISPSTIQVGVITAFIGAPLFLYLIIKNKKDEW